MATYNTFSDWLTALGGTYSRASTASYYNSSGVLTSASSGALRYDYDPVTLAPKGILLEGARTNVQTYSDDLSYWVPLGSTVSANVASAPSGAAIADKLVEDGTLGQHYIVTPNCTITAGAKITASLFIKAAGRTHLRVYVTDVATSTNGFSCRYDISTTGSINNTSATGSGTYTSSSITNVGNGWFRVTITGIVDGSSTSVRSFWYLSNDGTFNNWTGDSSSGMYLWGGQVEAGAFASSYIPTTSGSATRAADGLTFPTSPWFNANAGTFFVEFSFINPTTSDIGRRIFTLTGVSDTTIFKDTSSNTMRFFVYTSAYQAHSVLSGDGAGAIEKYAMGGTTGDWGFYNDGVAQTVNVESGTWSADTTFRLTGYDSSGTEHGFYWLRKLGYWPFRVSDAELQRLTA